VQNSGGGKVLNAEISRLNPSQTDCESEKELAQDHVGCQAVVIVVLVVVTNALVQYINTQAFIRTSTLNSRFPQLNLSNSKIL